MLFLDQEWMNMKRIDNTKKERYCRMFHYDSDITTFLQEHPDYKITHVAATDNFLWIIFEYEKE